jgi:hypothetical protein
MKNHSNAGRGRYAQPIHTSHLQWMPGGALCFPRLVSDLEILKKMPLGRFGASAAKWRDK